MAMQEALLGYRKSARTFSLTLFRRNGHVHQHSEGCPRNPLLREGQADGKDTLIPLSGKQGEHRGFPVHSLIITATSMLFLPISRLGIPGFMTGISLTGVTTRCANPHSLPYTTISFSKAWIRCAKAGYWPISRLRASWTRHRTVSARDWLVNHANLVSTIRLPDNLFTDAGTEVGSDLIVLQKNTSKIGTDRKGTELY